MRALLYPLLTVLFSMPTAVWAHPGHGLSESNVVAHLLEPGHAIVLVAFALVLMLAFGRKSPATR